MNLTLSVLDQSISCAGRGEDHALRDTVGLAEHCEALGYHRYWVSEHHNSASIVGTAEEVFAGAEMVVKVKEPQAVERARLREGQVLFTYLHLAPDRQQTLDLMQSGATCIAYETVTSPRGGLPLLAPMSQVAGRMSILADFAEQTLKLGGGRLARRSSDRKSTRLNSSH